jgi:hypothetical protein
MSLIKEKRFAIVLGGSTLVAVGGLVWFAISSSSQYDDALDAYHASAAEVNTAEKGALYPTRQNQDQKTKALADYRDDVAKMQTLFATFRPTGLPNIKPQTFADHLKETDAALRKEFAFEPVGTKLPPSFHFGFETYTGSLAKESATGILSYQLDAMNVLFSRLAAAHPSEIRNVFRPKLPEEDDQAFVPPADSIARPLSVEITFKAHEKALREFLTSLATADKYYYVVRTMAVSNEKQLAPTEKDAHFDSPKGKAPAGDLFGETGVVLPESGAGANPAPAKSSQPVVSSDSSRILKQVLGNEELVVFLRVDVLQFLPEKPLP